VTKPTPMRFSDSFAILLALVALCPTIAEEPNAQTNMREVIKDNPVVYLPPPATRAVDFARDIKPIFQNHCYECHGLSKDKGGLSLATRARALDGGDHGRVIVPGKSVLSPLVRLVAAVEEDHVMPPKGKRLSAEQVGLIRAWIDQGAAWPESADASDPRVAKVADHWSFKPLKRPALPQLKDAAWISSPIDAFILAKLDKAKLRPTPPANKEAWLRRVAFDLTGLPPTPDEIKVFVNDAGPEAYAKVVERLLASPAYGERWARHWLDVARYADSGGFETDIFYEQAWRYRDYVIRSFNDDKPYNRFLMEQVAGDELWPELGEPMQDAVAVWTLGEWQNALDAFPSELEYVRRTDQVVTFSEAMLGLTVGCANCHNHKYDPISQRDYFGLEAIFAASETWDKNTKQKQWIKGQRSAFRILRHAPTPTPIHLLTRGELAKPRGLVSPALPAFLPGGGSLPSGPEE
jgi:mono/diheme cytochrome c family protein